MHWQKVNKLKILFSIFLVFNLFSFIFARENVYDWYIKDFETEIIVNRDSSLLITEKITADCGNIPDKHGIFRILPTRIKSEKGVIETPIELISITDFNDNPLKYSIIKDFKKDTITWKIGDPKITVTGENDYKIVYRIKNAIRFNNPQFDELYWNLNGNFWDLEIDNFHAKIIFPPEVSFQNSQVEYYSGYLGEKRKDLAYFLWTADDILEFFSRKTLKQREGITASIIFPKNIFVPYEPGFFEQYGKYLWFLLPLFTFLLCYFIWRKHGKDPKINKTIIPEFEIPNNLSPLEMGALITCGKNKNRFITAEIINLAVKGVISIKEVEKAGFFHKKDFKITLLKDNFYGLNEIEIFLIKKVFGEKKEIFLSEMKRKFYRHLPELNNLAAADIVKKGLITQAGISWQKIFIAIAVITGIVFMIIKQIYLISVISLFIMVFTLISFSFVMPKRTQKGAELFWRVKGFKLYMKTAERDRQRFYEKENLFEKYLPYAMVFGMTKLWLKKMEEIYGKDYFQTYHPVWFYAAGGGAFSIESFESHLNSLSSEISSSVGGPSGAHGSGGAGGGGGGGGGGGW